MTAISNGQPQILAKTRNTLDFLLPATWVLFFGLLLFVMTNAFAEQAPRINTLEAVTYTSLSGDRVQVNLQLTNPIPAPASFAIDNPARIAIDLPATKSGLGKRKQTIGLGAADSLTAVEVKGRTRVVLTLNNMVSYDTRVDGKNVIITLGESATASSNHVSSSNNQLTSTQSGSITNVDFRRGTAGEGRVLIGLSDPSVIVNMRQEGGKVVLDFNNATVADELQRRLDVADFATPVQIIDTKRTRKGVQMTITPSGEYEHLAYQSNNQYIVEVRPTTKTAKEERRKQEVGFTGERLSLNFQDIEVRSILQLLADFTGTNIVVSDTVSGNLTLRMHNVPWDQALDIVLKTKGLAKRQNDNVMLIAPSEEIAARERLELESQKQIEELAPLYSDFVQVNYAKAADLASLLQDGNGSLLSDRGNVSIDTRTNTLLVQDTAEKLEQVRSMVKRLDVPVRQVLIEARIVLANDDFAKDLGVRFGLSRTSRFDNNHVYSIGGTRNGNINYGDTTTAFEVPAGSGNEGLMVNLPVTTAGGFSWVSL